jgi:TrmH family RNA methyltransferase
MKIKKLISSAANEQYKQLKKIPQNAKQRRKLQLTLLDGVHLLNSLAQSHQQPLEIFIKKDIVYSDREIAACLNQFPDITVTEITADLFDALSPVETPTGIIALYAPHAPAARHYNFAILLDRIQDPGNLGTLFRTVAAAGAEAVYLSKGCVDAWAPKVLRAGMGAHFGLAIYENADLINLAKQFPKVVATSLQARKSLYQLDLTGKLAFLFGNEGAGLAPELLQSANQQVRIPMPGNIESLNVAAACAVCVFERVRQMQTPS